MLGMDGMRHLHMREKSPKRVASACNVAENGEGLDQLAIQPDSPGAIVQKLKVELAPRPRTARGSRKIPACEGAEFRAVSEAFAAKQTASDPSALIPRGGSFAMPGMNQRPPFGRTRQRARPSTLLILHA